VLTGRREGEGEGSSRTHGTITFRRELKFGIHLLLAQTSLILLFSIGKDVFLSM